TTIYLFQDSLTILHLHSFPTRRSSDLAWKDFYNLGNFQPYDYNLTLAKQYLDQANITDFPTLDYRVSAGATSNLNAAQVIQTDRSEEHTSELQSRFDLVCRLLLEKKKK